MMALVFVRMLATVIVVLGGGAASLICAGIGSRDTGGVVLSTVLLAWALCPNNEDRAAFHEFQQQRLNNERR